MKTTCALDNMACIFDQLATNPIAVLGQADMLTLGILWCGIALSGAYLLTRN